MLNKKNILSLVLILVVVVSWTSILDKQAYILNIESLKESSSAFVILKAFDAVISFAENIPLIGKILSPYDDFVERMSFVMLLSVMSLGLQKVIIIAMQSFLINGIITLSSGVVLFNQYKQILSVDWANKLFKLLLVLIAIRFAIPFMTFAISSIETKTYEIQSEISQERIEKLQTKVYNIKNMLSNDEKIKMGKETKIKLLKEKIATLEKEKEELKVDIKNIKYADKSYLERAKQIIEDYTPEVKKQIEIRENRIKEIDEQIVISENKIEENEEGMFDFTDTKAKLKIALSNLNVMMTDMFDVFLTWTVLFFFRNIFFPLFFLWGMFKLVDKSFNRNYIDYASNKIMN